MSLCVSQGLSLILFRETLANGKQASNLFLTVVIKFVYQSAPLVYNAPQSSDSIKSINLWQFRSPNILIFGLMWLKLFHATKRGSCKALRHYIGYISAAMPSHRNMNILIVIMRYARVRHFCCDVTVRQVSWVRDIKIKQDEGPLMLLVHHVFNR